MGLGFFELLYQGHDLLEIMQQRSHPTLLGPNSFSHSALYGEIDAAHFWNISVDDWFLKPREARALMTAYARIAPVVEAIGNYDRSQFVRKNPHLFR
jgi:hypothetical protein